MDNNQVKGIVGNLIGKDDSEELLSRYNHADLRLILEELKNRNTPISKQPKLKKLIKIILNTLAKIDMDGLSSSIQRIIFYDIENIGYLDLVNGVNLTIFDTIIILSHVDSYEKLKTKLHGMIFNCNILFKHISTNEKQAVDIQYYNMCTALASLEKEIDLYVVSKDKGFDLYSSLSGINLTRVNSIKEIPYDKFINPTYKSLHKLLDNNIIEIVKIVNSEKLSSYLFSEEEKSIIKATRLEVIRMLLNNIELTTTQAEKINNLFGTDIAAKLVDNIEISEKFKVLEAENNSYKKKILELNLEIEQLKNQLNKSIVMTKENHIKEESTKNLNELIDTSKANNLKKSPLSFTSSNNSLPASLILKSKHDFKSLSISYLNKILKKSEIEKLLEKKQIKYNKNSKKLDLIKLLKSA
ncbi:MAG: hypothetical protein ACRDD2_08695 [Sarcina sp.]